MLPDGVCPGLLYGGVISMSCFWQKQGFIPKRGGISSFRCREEEERGLLITRYYNILLITNCCKTWCLYIISYQRRGNAGFLSVKLIFGSERIRLTLVYGLQEYSSESDKETFWHNVHVEVE